MGVPIYQSEWPILTISITVSSTFTKVYVCDLNSGSTVFCFCFSSLCFSSDCCVVVVQCG